MVDEVQLARLARRHAEWGRLRAAGRSALVIVPIAGLAALVGGGARGCILVGATLLMTAVALRWWSTKGTRAVRAGLTFGLLPMAAALVTVRLGQGLSLGGFDPCGPLCLLAGVLGGGAAAYTVAPKGEPARLQLWAAAALVASLTIALGCAPLGAVATISILSAVVVGAAAAALARELPAS